MKKIFWGLFFILAAALLIVNQMGYYEDINILTLLMTIFLIPIFFESLLKLEFFGVTLSTALLVILYKDIININDVSNFAIVAAALLLAIGLTIIFGRKKSKYSGNEYDQVINNNDESNIKFDVNFGSSIKYINCDDFRTADFDCSFGDMKVYFDNATILGESATVNINASLAGVELYIPKEWKVINKITATLASVEEKNHPKGEFTKTLILTGKVNLAGVEIIYI